MSVLWMSLVLYVVSKTSCVHYECPMDDMVLYVVSKTSCVHYESMDVFGTLCSLKDVLCTLGISYG